MSSVPVLSPAVSTSYAQRVAFVTEIAGRLHSYGTTAQRLEASLVALSQQLGLDCEPWSNPTGIILSFSDPAKTIGSSDITRVIRLAPGENDLYKLSVADNVAQAVASGRMSISQGHTALRRLDRELDRRSKMIQVFGFGLAAAGVAGLWKLPWLDIATASTVGLLIGLLTQYTDHRPATREASEALAALLAGFVATLVATLVGPINLNTVIIASVVVLLPGMSLTNAVNELSSQHWVSGTARLAGALTVVFKLTVGAVIAVNLCKLIGLKPQIYVAQTQPQWIEWVALLTTAYGFAVLFKARLRDYPWVMAAAMAGYVIARYAGKLWGNAEGVFLSAMALTAAGNLFGRLMPKPGALIRVPGIIMLVPGSTSMRGFMDVVEQQSINVGQDELLSVTNVVMALVAGLLFGNLLIPTRKNL
ncbi:threonine/serine exporter family protein [Xylella taiwanensis]|uniref:Membrane protein n=1 Tax=Xylella taiwanensis TaxID=1444770 RepID=Z9JLM5_9GAMM|nr:threonine/serine exporter family protein [Xylella taiwanensis]AXI83093.1 membrane protein [Xylella taiwanensis]EWS78731.1 membrane protein [Xylella taiwanensis]MCD8456127.1 threonine/serine exporter family protein [Xylella taiwanensis]MCD8458532.1 threonine/serine exporter family protein [Xylella taiwanensis]MCD8460667.1 threonine/serine exporter family protein [Xylella taiwanensis]